MTDPEQLTMLQCPLWWFKTDSGCQLQAFPKLTCFRQDIVLTYFNALDTYLIAIWLH